MSSPIKTACDGVVGKDTIMENGSHFYEILDLGFGRCRFALACRKRVRISSAAKRTVASNTRTSHGSSLKAAMDVRIIKIGGSWEARAPLLGLADGIVDIVETGAFKKTVWRSRRPSPVSAAASHH